MRVGTTLPLLTSSLSIKSTNKLFTAFQVIQFIKKHTLSQEAIKKCKVLVKNELIVTKNNQKPSDK